MVDTGGKQRHPEATERLMSWWTTGPGRLRVRWGEGGDYYRCLTELGRFVHNDHELHGLCQNLHQRATGMSTAEHAKLLGDHKHGSSAERLAARAARER